MISEDAIGMRIPSWEKVVSSQQTIVHMAEGEKQKQYKRLYPRRKASVPCQLVWQENQALGSSSDVSLGGLNVMLHSAVEPTHEGVEIRIPEGEGIVLQARPVHRQSLAKGTLVGFEIERIESGKRDWHRICYVPSW